MIVWGTGTPLRQFLYVNDLAELLLPILDTFDGGQMILCGPEEVAINAVAEQIRRTVGYKGPIVNDVTKSDGLFRKTVTSEHVLAKVFPDFVFTPLEHGIAQTYDWYRTTLPRGRVTGNLPGCRGLAGGLGNQFYLIAATLATGWKNNLTPFFRYDGSLHYRYNNDHRTGVLGMLEFDHATDLAAYQHTTDTDAECPGDTVVEGYFQDPRHFAGFEDRVFEVLRSHTPPPRSMTSSPVCAPGTPDARSCPFRSAEATTLY